MLDKRLGLGVGVGVVLAMASGCAVNTVAEGADADPGAPGVVRAETRVAPWPFDDLFTTPWASGNWKTPLPALPRATVGAFKGVDGLMRGEVTNSNPYPIEIGGAFWYKCTASQSNFNSVYLPGGVRPLVNPMIIAANGGSATFKFPLCAPVLTAANVDYRPHLPSSAVPFRDAFAQVGDGFNFFPYDQMRMSLGVPIARSGALNVAGHPYHNLYIRYSHSHPGHASALVKVGIRNSATGGVLQTFDNVAFPVTPSTDDFDQWQVVALKIQTASTVQAVYVRLDLQSNEYVYLDAAWIY